MAIPELDLQQHGYIPSAEILTTLQLALLLNKPILIEGPPGTGKTSLAISTALALKRELIRIQCYEGIDAIQIIGEFNYKKQLLQLQNNQIQIESKTELDIFSEEFFIPRPLFKAFSKEQNTVLLLDEIDSADEEFFAFLLEALGENQITIPEIGTIKAKNKPLVFLTSNNKQDLPEALRRRALYLYIDFPSFKRELEIIKFHCPDIEDNLIKSLVYIIQEIRKLDLRKHPSISESIDWSKSLLHLSLTKIDIETINKTINVILKHNEDIITVKTELEKILGKQ